MAEAQRSTTVEVAFPGGKRVSARCGAHQVTTDQPVVHGGDDSAPSPFELFFASLGTCAGYYVLEFCRSREIPLDGVRMTQDYTRCPETKRVTDVRLSITVPPTFPAKYHAAVAQAAGRCAVKKLLEHPPAMDVRVQLG
ncbi:MAG: OsmC family protein [Planctomycetes bacterium]|nr:OsmC family protein [Planctomycetota bacterium]